MDEDENRLLIEYDIASSMKVIDINWQAYRVVGKYIMLFVCAQEEYFLVIEVRCINKWVLLQKKDWDIATNEK